LTQECCAWWYVSVIPELQRPRQGDYEFEVRLGDTTRPFLKYQNKIKNRNNKIQMKDNIDEWFSEVSPVNR
jgi:hypothetical protein